MDEKDGVKSAACLLTGNWRRAAHIAELPAGCRPQTRAEGYAVQQLWPRLLGRRVAGWKIAATSKAGQAHIAVSGPIAGPVFAHRVQGEGAVISLASNRMRVAECEIVFRLSDPLLPRAQRYARDDVLKAIASVHPGIEVPDSRFVPFETVGEAQLIADCACTNDMVVGAPVVPDERLNRLPALEVHAHVSDGRVQQGFGSNVLGDPIEAMVWAVNELGAAGQVLEEGQFVTTGACVAPIPITPGLHLQADFGWLGRITATFT